MIRLAMALHMLSIHALGRLKILDLPLNLLFRLSQLVTHCLLGLRDPFPPSLFSFRSFVLNP